MQKADLAPEQLACVELDKRKHLLIKGASGNVFTPGVKLTTFHSAKGPEFDVVIVAQVNDGNLPQAPARYHGDMATEDLEEYLAYARQLLYVAMTRAPGALPDVLDAALAVPGGARPGCVPSGGCAGDGRRAGQLRSIGERRKLRRLIVRTDFC